MRHVCHILMRSLRLHTHCHVASECIHVPVLTLSCNGEPQAQENCTGVRCKHGARWLSEVCWRCPGGSQRKGCCYVRAWAWTLGILERSAGGTEPGLPFLRLCCAFRLTVHHSFSWAWIQLRLGPLRLWMNLDHLSLSLAPPTSTLATLTTSILAKSSTLVTLISVHLLLSPLRVLPRQGSLGNAWLENRTHWNKSLPMKVLAWPSDSPTYRQLRNLSMHWK